MWSGSEIVRVAGQPAANQYVSVTSKSSEQIPTVPEALRQGIYDQSGSQPEVEVVSSKQSPNFTLKRAGRPLIISGALHFCADRYYDPARSICGWCLYGVHLRISNC